VAVIAAVELHEERAAGSARARRIALIAASVPELTRRTSSIDGKARVIASAMSTSSPVGAP